MDVKNLADELKNKILRKMYHMMKEKEEDESSDLPQAA